MSTILYPGGTKTGRVLRLNGQYPFDLLEGNSNAMTARITTVDNASELQLKFDASAVGYADQDMLFLSQRVAAPVTISGNITAFLNADEANDLANARLRVRLSKLSRTADVETDIAVLDMTGELTVATNNYTLSGTPPVPVSLAVDERLIARISAIPIAGGAMAGGYIVKTQFQGVAGGSTFPNITFTETITFKTNGTVLYPRRTSTIGIGNFFDLLPTLGASVETTGVVNTAAGGTNIQWTRTAGGTVLEWVSPRFKNAWNFKNPDDLPLMDLGDAARITVTAFESATAANAALRVRLFRLRAGVETEIVLVSSATELPTTALQVTLKSTNGTTTPVTFLPDDRLVFRAYITNGGGTMASGRTATLNYDGNNAGGPRINLLESCDFKAESDPAETGIVPSGGATFGMSNGQ